VRQLVERGPAATIAFAPALPIRQLSGLPTRRCPGATVAMCESTARALPARVQTWGPDVITGCEAKARDPWMARRDLLQVETDRGVWQKRGRASGDGAVATECRCSCPPGPAERRSLGKLIHPSEYRNGGRGMGKRALVIGAWQQRADRHGPGGRGSIIRCYCIRNQILMTRAIHLAAGAAHQFRDDQPSTHMDKVARRVMRLALAMRAGTASKARLRAVIKINGCRWIGRGLAAGAVKQGRVIVNGLP